MKVYYRLDPATPWKRLQGPGDLRGRIGGEVRISGEAEFQYEAGSWGDAVSNFVIRCGGSVRRLP